MDWIDVMPAAELDAKRKSLVRVDGRQILIMRTERGVAACSNRCPHEGYPLSEGELSDDGTLRCNWHNWTFDVVSGETLVGGDVLAQFPIKIEGGRVLLASQPPDPAEGARRALVGIASALEDADQPRLLRETVRLGLAGGNRLDAIREAITWVAPRLQYGTTHAFAGAADWLTLAQAPDTEPDQQLAALGEILGHIADDGRRERRFPFATDVRAWDAGAFLAAIEVADEVTAAALVRGALAAGMSVAALLPTLATAALAHYADFGHALIYTVKTTELVELLGDRVAEPILLLLVRSFCYASREDLLPEFRGYAAALERWNAAIPQASGAPPALLTDVSVRGALDAVVKWSATYAPHEIFRTLVDSAALTLLRVSEAAFTTTRGTIVKNSGWLDHTHAITFADAGERVARVSPELWPAVLLQLACFIGRSRPFVNADVNVGDVRSNDPQRVFATLRESLFDHGRDRYIISVHLIKTLFGATRLVDGGHADPLVMAAALNRFFHAPIKGRHVIRTARQMLAVACDG